MLCLLLAGDDQINAMKQITQFGINQSIAVGGALFELEQIAALPEAARYGVWTFEWYWNQPGVPHVAEFVKRYNTAYRRHVSVAALLVRLCLGACAGAGLREGEQHRFR